MGNTNLPQFGAADTENSRDTLPGERQLTPKQRTQEARVWGSAETSPAGPTNAAERIPDQHCAADDATTVEAVADKDEKTRRRDSDGDIAAERPGDASSADPRADGVARYRGHANTGHSPSKAT